MLSKLMVSDTDFWGSSTAIAFSKAILFTTLLHSLNLALASLSFGLALVT